VQHQEAIRVISRLGPELTKQAAEGVLLRYAETEDLAPAQLEKLAQAYNMVRQLSHIDASDDRGSTCHQIDTPALLRSYAGETSKAAHVAAPLEAVTHDAGSVDLMSELRREMRPVVKAASELSVEVTHPSVPAPSPEADVRYTAEQLKEAAWEAKVDFYLIADSIIKMARCEGRTLQIAQAEQDASRLVNAVCVAASLDWLEKYAAQQKISRVLSRHEGPVKAAAFAITTPLADKIAELAEAFVVTRLFEKLAAEGGKTMEEIAAETAAPGVPDPDAGKQTMDDLLKEFTDQNPAPKRVEPTPFNPPPESPKAEEAADTGKGVNVGKGGGSGQGKKKGETETAKGSGGHWLASIISGATKPVSAASDMVGAAATGAKGAVNAITSKERVNKNQVKLDGDIGDIRRSILIRRLAASDPVLKDMPLKDVLETYNAIAESNPEAASNPRRVLLAMREAASYEGITLDAQKSLGDVRGAAAKTDAAEADNTKRRYSV
jgi:hypothetical protein